MDSDRGTRTVGPRALGVLAVLAISLGVASGWLLPEVPTALRSGQPDLGAQVARAPERVWLDFGQSVVPGPGSSVTVLDPDDNNLARGPALPSSDGISQPVAPLPERGAYQVAYEVRLVDGQVSRGQYWFWYAPNPSGSFSRLESPPLLGLLVALAAALAAGLLGRGRTAQSPVTVPAQRAGSPPRVTSAHPVPTQRSRDSHTGPSPPGSSPRARPAPGRPGGSASPEPAGRDEPRRV